MSQINQFLQADEVGFITYTGYDENYYGVLDGSSKFFESNEAKDMILMVRQLVLEQQEALFIGDFHTKKGGQQTPYRSVMAVPMNNHEKLNGIAMVFHKDPYVFSFESFKLLQSLVHHSTLAFVNSILREELEKTVITDYLTNLHTRYYLDQYIDERLAEDGCGNFILFDIDNFKAINDTYGHQTGDNVIKQVANAIQTNVIDKGWAAR